MAPRKTVKMYIPDSTPEAHLILASGQVMTATQDGADVPIESIPAAIAMGLCFKINVGGTDYFIPPAG